MRIPVLLLLAAALLVGAWFGLGSGIGDPLDPVYAASPGGPRAGELPGALDSDVESARASESGGRREIEVALPGSSEDSDAAKGEEPESLAVGRVLDPGHAPLEGALVVARRSEYWSHLPPDLEPDTNTGLASGRREALTDGEGRYCFEDLSPNEYDFVVRASGYAPLHRSDVKVPVHEHHDLGDSIVARGVLLEGTVSGREGKGVADVDVLVAVSTKSGSTRLSIPGRGIPAARTDGQGFFRVDTLEPGPWHLIFDAPEYRIEELSGTTEPAGSVERGLSVVLREGLSIQGRVTDYPREAGEELRVIARALDEQPASAPKDLSDSERSRPRYSVVERDSSFEVRGLPQGVQYLLRLQRRSPSAREGSEESTEPEESPWKRVASVSKVEAFAGDREVELSHRAEASLEFHVVSAADGSPVERMLVQVSGEGTGGGGLRRLDEEVQQRFPGGFVRFDGLRPRRSGSLVDLKIRAEGFVDYERTGLHLVSGSEVKLDRIQLEPAPRVTVRVVDAVGGEGVENTKVLIARPMAEEDLEGYVNYGHDYRPWFDENVNVAYTDEEGRAVLTGFAGEVCLLRASAVGFTPSEDERILPPLDGQSVELVVELAGSVLVRVRDERGEPVPGAYVLRSNEESGVVWDYWDGATRTRSSTDESGEVLFEGLQPGSWSFQVVDSSELSHGYWRMPSVDPEESESVLVERGARVEIELSAPSKGGLVGQLLVGGAPCVGALARLERQGGESVDTWYWGGAATGDRSKSVSDHEGNIRFEGLDLGRYDMIVSHPERRMARLFEVEVVREPSPSVFELGTSAVEGRIVTPEGEPIQGVRVSIAPVDREERLSTDDYSITIREDEDGDESWEWNSVSQGSRRTDRNGAYSLPGVRPDLELELSASDTWVVGESRTLEPLGRDEVRTGVDFVLRRAGQVELVLQGLPRSDDRRFRATMTLLDRGEGEGQVSKSATLKSRRRRRRVGSMLPGTWKLELRVRGADEVLATREFEIRALEKTVVDLSIF